MTATYTTNGNGDLKGSPSPLKLNRFIAGTSFLEKIALYMNYTSIAVLFLMILVTFADVFMRYVVKNSIVGMKEITEVMLFTMIGMCMAHTTATGRHIQVDLVTGALKPKAKASVALGASLITAVFLGFATFSSIKLLSLYVETGRTHGAIMQITLWPFILLCTLGFFLAWLLSVRNVLKVIAKAAEEKVPAIGYILGFGLAVLILAFFGALVTKTVRFDKGILCLGALVFMFILMFSGVPIGYTLWTIGTVLIGNIRGFSAALTQMAAFNLAVTSNYTWSVVAFFLLMGFLCFFSRFGEDIFRCLNMFLAKLRGGICIVTIAASACLAAVVGDNNAVVSTMSSIGYPEMKKLKYDDKLAMGTLAAGSCLGPLIPPSTGFITYSLLTMVSLGKLFASGIISGIILAIAFIITIVIICRLDPSKGPRGEAHTRREKIASLPYALPIILLFVFVIGGTMVGIFTATEGGAMGCVGALIIALIMGRCKFQTMFNAFSEAGALSGMIFSVIVGAQVFSSGLSWCNLNNTVTAFFGSLNWSPNLTIAFILFCFFLAGFFIDLMPLMFVGIPIVYGIVQGMGVDGVWFGCLLVMIINTGVITPPFATVLFVMKGLMPEVPIKKIFAGVTPFVIATVLVVILLFFVLELVTWLPNSLGK